MPDKRETHHVLECVEQKNGAEGMVIRLVVSMMRTWTVDEDFGIFRSGAGTIMEAGMNEPDM